MARVGGWLVKRRGLIVKRRGFSFLTLGAVTWEIVLGRGTGNRRLGVTRRLDYTYVRIYGHVTLGRGKDINTARLIWWLSCLNVVE